MAEHENKHRKILNESGKARKCEYLAQKSSQTMRYQFKWNFEKRNIAIAPSVAVTSATEWQLRYRKNHFMTFKQNRFKPTNNLNSKQTSKRTNRTERNGTEWNRIDRYICTTKRANIKRNQIKLSLIKIKHNVSLAIVLGSVLICYILRAVLCCAALRCAMSWIRFESKISSTSIRCNKNQWCEICYTLANTVQTLAQK